MRRAIAIVLCAVSAAANVDVLLGIRSQRTYTGSGTNLVATWGSVTPERIDYGAWLHLDATYAAGISNIVANSTNFVYKWSDWRGNGNYAGPDVYYTGMPFVSAAFQNNKNVVRFLPYVNSSLQDSPNLRLSQDKTDIFAVFAVVKLYQPTEYVPLLGGYVTYDFHGSTGGQLIHPEWSNPKVYGGSNAMDGVSMTVATIYPTNVFHVVSVRTSGGGVSANNIGRDRSFRSGGIDFAELLIFTNPVSDSATSSITAYLRNKWGITVAP